MIIKYYKIYGSDWDKIAEHIPERTASMIKNRYYSSVKKRSQQELEETENRGEEVSSNETAESHHQAFIAQQHQVEEPKPEPFFKNTSTPLMPAMGGFEATDDDFGFDNHHHYIMEGFDDYNDNMGSFFQEKDDMNNLFNPENAIKGGDNHHHDLFESPKIGVNIDNEREYHSETPNHNYPGSNELINTKLYGNDFNQQQDFLNYIRDTPELQNSMHLLENAKLTVKDKVKAVTQNNMLVKAIGSDGNNQNKALEKITLLKDRIQTIQNLFREARIEISRMKQQKA
mmetsp:Transcript_22313/g.19186  ORF Transcript_22313/g.19186 Transcript_22313/m.19186 type:complete len:286 (+) Transcript_22313:1151-2008(+)